MIVAQVVRSGIVESEHRGAVAVVDQTGRPLAGVGQIDRPFLIRSVAKPVQAEVAVRMGVVLAAEHLAISAASHDGEPVHVATVAQILADGDLTENDLECPPGWPASPTARRAVVRSGVEHPRRIWHNCSGKHATMLRACVARGWATSGYTAPDHPLQVEIAGAMESALGMAGGWGSWAVDGCGTPVSSANAYGVAHMFARLGSENGTVVGAMRRFPALVGGRRHSDFAVMVALPAIAKRGAEATFGCAIEGRGAVGIKIWDGSERAVGPVLFEALDQLGWIPSGPRGALECRTASPVLGGGTDVGTVRPAFRLEPL